MWPNRCQSHYSIQIVFPLIPPVIAGYFSQYPVTLLVPTYAKHYVWYAASAADTVPWVNVLELVSGMKKMDRCISRSNPASWISVARGPFVYIRNMFCASGNEPVSAWHNGIETLVPWCSFTTMLRCFSASGHVCRGTYLFSLLVQMMVLCDWIIQRWNIAYCNAFILW